MTRRASTHAPTRRTVRIVRCRMSHLRSLLFVLLACAGAPAQILPFVALPAARSSRSCARLSIASDEPAVVVPIERALRATQAFARGEFTLSDTPGNAAVAIFARS